jgi:hypothetical protein
MQIGTPITREDEPMPPKSPHLMVTLAVEVTRV